MSNLEVLLRVSAGLTLAFTALGQKQPGYSSIKLPFTSAGRPTIADFDGDGRPDFAVINGTSGLVQIWLGNGDGTFDAGAPLPVLIHPLAIASADFNGDGKPDLAVCLQSINPGSQRNSAAILLNDGAGNFRQGENLSAADCGGSFLAVDLNGDGKPDIYDSGSYIWLGNGDGTFTGRAIFNPPLARQPVIADFNGDGLPDLAGQLGIDDPHQVGIWFNHKGANFDSGPTTVINFTTSFGETVPDSLAAGDFNGDGKADLAVLTAVGGLYIFPGNGDGTFRSGAHYQPWGQPGGAQGLYAQDMDGDEKLDLVVTLDRTVILHGKGDGTFTTPVNICTGGSLGLIADDGSNVGVLSFGDFNRDGFMDMLSTADETSEQGPGVSAIALSGATDPPVIHTGSPSNAASFAEGPIAPAELVTVFGDDLGDDACNGRGSQILFNGFSSATLFGSSTQINAEVPWEIAGLSEAQMVVMRNGLPSTPVSVALQSTAPAVFTVSGQGAQGAIVPAGSTNVAQPGTPATRGQIASLYATGLGPVTNQPATGDGSPTGPYAVTETTPRVTVGGTNGEVVFSGLTPYLVGVYQINFRIPTTAPAGDAVPLVVTANGVASNTVTLALK